MAKWAAVAAALILAVAATGLLVSRGGEDNGAQVPGAGSQVFTPRGLVGGTLDINIGTPTATSTPGANTANCWVNTTAGASPQRLTTAAAYDSTKAYGTWDAAWDACTTSGDVVGVRPGNYGAVAVTGSHASATQIIGDAKATVIMSSLDTGSATNVRLQNATIDTGTAIAGWDPGSNNTATNVDILGGQPHVTFDGTTDAKWLGGVFGGRTPTQRGCTGQHEPIEIQGATGTVVSGVTFWPQAVLEGDGTCPDGHYHLETFRIDRGSSNILIERNRLKANDGSNSATVLITEYPPGSGVPHDITFQNNIFEGFIPGTYTIGTDTVITTCTNLVLAYNTFVDGESFNFSSCSSWPGTKIIGNAGPHGDGSCYGAATWAKNRFQHNFSYTPCGTSALTIGTAYQSGSLGINSTGDVQAGSSLIVAGEGTYCRAAGGLTGLGGVDFNGDARPASGNCTVGAQEYP